MISGRSGDGMMMLGVEKEIELEEGEASYYQNGDETRVDPDVSLSYIDEKIQDILGHFQKDFEGGVSAENLGAKFGGYGSFLPTYTRPPACSQQRTTSEVIDGNIPNSPRILDFEPSQFSSLASSCSPLPMMLETGSTANPKGHGSINGKVRRDGRVPFNSVETLNLNSEQKSEFAYDQRTLKVRLKVGSNKLPTRKNAEIYSGLGLDGSPSPSFNDSYTDSEGLSHDIIDPSRNSPTSILKIMTSFLLQGTQLLSPLSEELMRFTEKDKYSRESLSKPLHKEKVNGYDSRKNRYEPVPETKTDSFENGEILDTREHRNMGLLLKREADINDLACEELVTNALKLPLLSNMQTGPPYPAEGSVKAADLPRASNKGPSSGRPAVLQTLEHESAQEIGRIQQSKGNAGLSGNISILKKESLVDDCTILKKPSRHKGQINTVSVKVESGLPERERDSTSDLFDSRETKSMQPDVYNTEVIGNHSQGEEQVCALGRNKLEGGQSHDSPSKVGSYKKNNGTHINSLLPKNASVNTSKGLKKITNKYQEFFGDLDFEQDDNEAASKEVSSVKKLMSSKLEENGGTLEDIQIAKETSSVSETGKPYKAEEYPRASSNEKVPSTVAAPKADAISSVPAPELEDLWVQCDKCQTWRLLPLGRNPRSLPEKWMCSMLDWLPAMNRCTFSEEETTNAVRALYQVPAPLGAECKPPGHPGNNLSVVSSTAVSNLVHNEKMFDQQTSHTGVEKKQKPKDESSRPRCAEQLQLSKSMKNHQMKNKSLVSADQSSLVDAYGNPYAGQCSSSLSENHANKLPKKSSLGNCSVGVDAKNMKARKMIQSDSDSSRSSKKVKSQGVLYNDENCMSAPPVHLLKSGHFLGNTSPNHMSRKEKRTIDGHPKVFENEFFNHITATEITYDSPLPIHKRDGKNSSKKKKGQEEEGTRSYVGDLPRVGHQSRGRSEDNQRRVKKARTSNSEGKDPTTKKSTCETGRKARKSVDKQIRRERGSSGTADSSKRDLGSVHPSGASISSSSKVSGSCKIKTECQELKGSPEESVSSSPLRVQSTDNCDATRPISDAGSKGNPSTFRNQDSKRYQDDRKEDRTFSLGSHSRKLENDISLHHGNCIISENEKVHLTSPNSKNGALDDIPLSNGKLTGGKSRFQESCASFDKDENNFISQKRSVVKDIERTSGRENKLPGCNDRLDDKLDMKDIIVHDHDVKDSSNKLFSDIRNASEISGSGRSHSLPPSARYKNDKRAHLPLISGPQKENGADITLSDAHGDTSRILEQNKKGEQQNGSTPLRHSTATMNKVRHHDGSSVRKDSRSQAATNAMKEAKDLKRLADRFKNSGSADSTGMYFEAALKFLYGASLLESGSRENNKHNDFQCIDMYRSTAKFCEFCAHEYERSKDMASASLAYKCMEVSYMRVIYTSHGNTNRDRNEVQKALQIVPPGESPASSASDVDNLNNPVTVDKVSASKGMTSPQVAGNTGITARNRSSFTRLLEFAQDVSAAMDAARKSRATFTAANLRSGDADPLDGFSTVKKALDFNFRDVDGLLRLIRIAKDAISR